MESSNQYIVKMPSGEEIQAQRGDVLQQMVLEQKLPPDALVRPVLLMQWTRADEATFLKESFRKLKDNLTIRDGRRYLEAPFKVRCKSVLLDCGVMAVSALLLFVVFVILRRTNSIGTIAPALYCISLWMCILLYISIPTALYGRAIGGVVFKIAILNKDFTTPTLFRACAHSLMRIFFWWLDLLAIFFTGRDVLLTDRICGLKAFQSFKVIE